MGKSTIRKLMLMAAMSTALLSCSDKEPSFSLLSEVDEFVQSSSSFTNKIDVLFVIDDQPSMSSFQDELVQSFDTFINLFANKGYDFRIAVVTTSAYLADPTLNGYNSADDAEADLNQDDGTNDSGTPIIEDGDPDILTKFAINAKPSKNTAGQDVRAFSSFRQALSTGRLPNANFRRPDAFLAVVIVDNAEDFSGNGRCSGCNVSGRYNAPTLDPVSDYVNFLDTYTQSTGASRRYNVSAMTQSGTPCQGGQNMVRIMDLVAQTDGVVGDICDADFGPSLVLISDQIATLSTRFELDREPKVSSIVVKVNNVTVPNDANNGWTYESASNSIFFHGSAIPAEGDRIAVDYDPESVIQ